MSDHGLVGAIIALMLGACAGRERYDPMKRFAKFLRRRAREANICRAARSCLARQAARRLLA